MEDNKLLLKPMRRVLVSDEIIEQIKNLILKGELKPGDHLPSEIKMALQMNVGRSTIREALKVLTHLGFIEQKKRVRVVSEYVKEMLAPHEIVERFKRHRNLLEMIEVRKILEPDAASLAATRCEPKDIDLIKQDVDYMTETIGDPEAFIQNDHQFHIHLAQGSKNQILIEIIQGIREMLVKTQGLILRRSKDISPRSLDFHRKIFNAVQDENPALAKKLMHDHIIDIEKELYTILKEQNNSMNVA